MVGVPGRSSACQPCKKRRIACDQQQPQCARCLLGKRLCEYTQGQRIFVLNDAGSHKTIYKKKDGEVADRERRAKASGEKVQATNSEDQQTAALILSKQPSSSALHQQSLLAYALDDQLSRRHKAGYMQDLASSSAASNIMDSCLRPSFLAYYIAWLTRRESMDDPRLTAAGRELYICALQETHSALANRRTALSDSTLAACQALAAYEALECPGGTLQAWEWHQAALGRLVRLRGPAAHVDGPAWQVFTGFRLYSILQAFDSGHDTFLAKPEWTDIPFSVHPKRKLDELLDIFALGPQVSRMGSTLSTLPSDQVAPTAFSMVDKLLLIIKKLQDFEQRLERESEVPLYQERSLPLNPHHASEQPGDAEFIFPPIFWFADLDTALLLTLFWAMSAMAYSGLLNLHALFQEHNLSHVFATATASLANLSDAQYLHFLLRDRARKVLQSVAYCTTPAAVELGPPRVTTQLVIVSDVLKNNSACEAEYQWALRARVRMGEKYARILKCDT